MIDNNELKRAMALIIFLFGIAIFFIGLLVGYGLCKGVG